MMLKANELRLGDSIQVYDNDAYGCAIVTQITETHVHTFRPYATCSDFSYTGGVIPYVGIETIQYSLSSDQTFKVWRRMDIR